MFCIYIKKQQKSLQNKRFKGGIIQGRLGCKSLYLQQVFWIPLVLDLFSWFFSCVYPLLDWILCFFLYFIDSCTRKKRIRGINIDSFSEQLISSSCKIWVFKSCDRLHRLLINKKYLSIFYWSNFCTDDTNSWPSKFCNCYLPCAQKKKWIIFYIRNNFNFSSIYYFPYLSCFCRMAMLNEYTMYVIFILELLMFVITVGILIC